MLLWHKLLRGFIATRIARVRPEKYDENSTLQILMHFSLFLEIIENLRSLQIRPTLMTQIL